MNPALFHGLRIHATLEHWRRIAPLHITGYTWDTVDVLLLSLEQDGHLGRGEAAGVYYKNDTPVSMLQQLEHLRPEIERGIGRATLPGLLPAGGARNALDCALWDLEVKITGQAAWQMAGLERAPQPLLTTYTCGADTPEAMAAKARGFSAARAIKLKLTGEPVDAERVLAVRAARPDVWLSVDANQGLDRPALERLMPTLLTANVQLIEQPFPVGEDALLEGFRSPIAIAADESLQTLAQMPALVGRFQRVNIKLDKCGGLTDALAMARLAKELGLDIMVGNMMGTSLAMAPAYVVGQLCDVVDLDGPLFLRQDRVGGVRYADGRIACPEALWGYPVSH